MLEVQNTLVSILNPTVLTWYIMHVELLLSQIYNSLVISIL